MIRLVDGTIGPASGAHSASIRRKLIRKHDLIHHDPNAADRIRRHRLCLDRTGHMVRIIVVPHYVMLQLMVCLCAAHCS